VAFAFCVLLKLVRMRFLLLLWLLPIVSVQAQSKQFINPFTIQPPGYTHVVAVSGGTTIYISGQVPVNEKGETVGKGDFRAQVVQVYENLKTALTAAGATFQDVVKMNTYVVNYRPEDVAVIREVRKEYLSASQPPASTLVGIQALVNPDFRIEIEAVAVIK
jgi:enamine deaminase RidA (YjgF/YER057c/UK114 family)